MPRPSQRALLLLAGCQLALSAEPPDSRDFFEKRIRPVLSKSCFGCHASTKMGGLDMASREGLLKGGNSGPALVPGKPEESLLIQAVNHQHERIKMPLQQPKLADEHISNLVDWVKAGAYWPADVAVAAPKGSNYVITPAQKSDRKSVV